MGEYEWEIAGLKAELDLVRSNDKAARDALADCIRAMETWGSWEDGIPASDEGGEYGFVGQAYDMAKVVLAWAETNSERFAAVMRVQREIDAAMKVVAAVRGVSANADGGFDGVLDALEALKAFDAAKTGGRDG